MTKHKILTIWQLQTDKMAAHVGNFPSRARIMRKELPTQGWEQGGREAVPRPKNDSPHDGHILTFFNISELAMSENFRNFALKIKKINIMSANKQTTEMAGRCCLPKQHINNFIFSAMLEDILNAADQDDPLHPTLTTWAQKAWNCGTMDWILNYPCEFIDIEWPMWPLGRDNQRLHEFYADAKRRLLALYPEMGCGQQHRRGGTGRPQPETDPQKQSNSNANIALAQACRQRWATIGLANRKR